MKNFRDIITIMVLFTFFVSNINAQKVTVTGIVYTHRPYCGGASPPPHLAKGTSTPRANFELHLVKKGDTLRKSLLCFKTDENGNFEIKIDKGSYWIFSNNKMVSFDEFYKNNSQPVSNSVNMFLSCYKDWYNAPDFILDAKENSFVEITFYSSCFTGTNPCLQYTGPYPP